MVDALLLGARQINKGELADVDFIIDGPFDGDDDDCMRSGRELVGFSFGYHSPFVSVGNQLVCLF